jgi:pimeloyl-ACP methyl ester carboxylesterase
MRRTRSFRFAAWVALAALLLAAAALSPTCAQDSAGEIPATVPPGGVSQPVRFTTADGLTLGGHLFGSGPSAVILTHMYPADQTSWYPTAERLADAGYRVLTFDFRGYGESQGDRQIDRIDGDVAAALAYLRSAGAAEVVLVGASMGGTAALAAAAEAQSLSSMRLAGVVTLSAPVEFKGLSAVEAVPRLVVPVLLIAAEEDAGAEGARRLADLAGGPVELRILPGDEHGTRLLEGDQAETVYGLVLEFLKANLGAGGPH